MFGLILGVFEPDFDVLDATLLGAGTLKLKLYTEAGTLMSTPVAKKESIKCITCITDNSELRQNVMQKGGRRGSHTHTHTHTHTHVGTPLYLNTWGWAMLNQRWINVDLLNQR